MRYELHVCMSMFSTHGNQADNVDQREDILLLKRHISLGQTELKNRRNKIQPTEINIV